MNTDAVRLHGLCWSVIWEKKPYAEVHVSCLNRKPIHSCTPWALGSVSLTWLVLEEPVTTDNSKSKVYLLVIYELVTKITWVFKSDRNFHYPWFIWSIKYCWIRWRIWHEVVASWISAFDGIHLVVFGNFALKLMLYRTSHKMFPVSKSHDCEIWLGNQ